MAVKIGMSPPFPGGFIRRSIRPKGLSANDAARAPGVGRPALSKLLNERASLSPGMAFRVEKDFGVKMDTLLRMQTSFAAHQIRQCEKDIKVKRFQAA